MHLQILEVPNVYKPVKCFRTQLTTKAQEQAEAKNKKVHWSVSQNYTREELQLLGLNVMFVASKCEEIWPVPMDDFECISAGVCAHEQIIDLETSILGNYNGVLTVPAPFPSVYH